MEVLTAHGRESDSHEIGTPLILIGCRGLDGFHNIGVPL